MAGITQACSKCGYSGWFSAPAGAPLTCPNGCGPFIGDDRDRRISELEAEVEHQKALYAGMVSDRDDWRKRCDEAQGVLASTGDLLNSWARESSVQETPNYLGVHALSDRLWAYWSGKYHSSQTEVAALREDKERLDWLEQRRLALNKHYGTAYGWEFVSSHNVNRLFVAGTCTIDLNDAKANAGNIRAAIDAARAKERGGS